MAETTKKQRFEVGTRFVGNVNYVPMEVIGIHDPWKGCQYEGVFKPAPRAVIRNLLTGNTSTYGLSALEHCDVTILDNGVIWTACISFWRNWVTSCRMKKRICKTAPIPCSIRSLRRMPAN